MSGLFDNIVSELGWVPEDGSAPGHYRDKRLGHQCFWTCCWATSKGLLTSRDILPSEEISREQLILELKDILERGESEYIQEVSVLLARLQSENLDSKDIGKSARKLLGKMNRSRRTYPEYVSFWDVPERIIIRKWRPGGWPNPDKFIKE